MYRNKKVVTKIISFAAAAVILFGLTAVSAELFPEVLTHHIYAAEISGDFTIADYKGGTEIIKYSGSGRNVTIPSTLNGKEVLSIADDSFRNDGTVRNVVIPDSVTRIGKSAFADCPQLRTVVFGKNVKSAAFTSFANLSDDFTIYGRKNSYAEGYSRSRNLHFQELLSDNGSCIEESLAFAGQTVTVYANFKGGVGGYKYRYSVRKNSTESWNNLSSLTESSSYAVRIPDMVGTCSIRVTAVDNNNVSAYQVLNINVVKNTNQQFVKNNVTISSEKPDMNTPVKADVNVGGGVQPYVYKYSYRPYGQSEWTYDTAYTDSSTHSFKIAQPGKYSVRIAAKDAVGNYVSEYKTITVKKNTGKPLNINSSSLSTGSAWANWNITANIKTSGGTEPYSYRYSYKKQGSTDWTYVSSYTSSASRKIKMPGSAGVYTVRLAVSDADGNYTSKYINVTVKKDSGTAFKENNSSVDHSKLSETGTVTAKASFKGGVSPYQYKYSYRTTNGVWTDITSYTNNSSNQIRLPGNTGNYTIRIAAKDAIGSYQSKYVNVNTVDPSNPEIFVKQQTSVTCTLASNVMLLRRYAYLNGNSWWKDITESSCRSSMWCDAGMYSEYTYKGYHVSYKNIQSYSDRKKKLIEELKNHPEGLVIYEFNIPHAIFLTDYTNGTFYVADPARNKPAGRIPISQTDLDISGIDAIWYIEK